jgi:EpsI family protein
MSEARAVVLMLLLAVTAVMAQPAEPRTARPTGIAALPYAVGGWQGVDDGSLDRATAAQLGADEYVTRTYSNGDQAPVGLYVAYYASQRPGVSIHSPLHCLPGTGWEALDVATMTVPAGGAAGGSGGNIRRLIMRKNLDRAVVMYWYQLHGRMVANEVKSKLYLLGDSLRLRRSDAALVRIVVPVGGEPDAAAARGLSFVRELLPQLTPLL